MRNAFGILEALLSLIIFSVVILVCSKTLLEVNKDLRLFKKTQSENADFSNAMLYIRKALHYGIITSFSPQEIEFFEVDREVFLKPNFYPIPTPCPSAKIQGSRSTKAIAFFDKSMEVIGVVGYKDRDLLLEREIGCGIAIPLKSKHRIWLRGENLLLDEVHLLEGVERVDFVELERFYQIEICRKTCSRHQIPKGKVAYEF